MKGTRLDLIYRTLFVRSVDEYFTNLADAR